jgi:hypothetical protein
MQTTAYPALHLDRETLLYLDRSLFREWHETAGLGSYASSTVVCCPTRRYHGLLVGYPPGSSKRHNFLSRFGGTVLGTRCLMASGESPELFVRTGAWPRSCAFGDVNEWGPWWEAGVPSLGGEPW